MAEALDLEQSTLIVERLNQALSNGLFVQARRQLNELEPADIAYALEASPPRARKLVWKLLDEEREGEVLQYLGEELRESFLRQMAPRELAAATADLDTDDLADILNSLPDEVFREVLLSMDARDRLRVEAVLSYPEDCAGGIMNTDTVTVKPDVTVEVVLRYLRMKGELPEGTDALFVVDEEDRLLGSVPLTILVTSQPEQSIASIMDSDTEVLLAEESDTEVAKLFERRDLISAPVVDRGNRLIGRITIDDVVDVIRDEADASMKSMAGLTEDEETFAPVLPSARRRVVWLSINLCSALLAALVNNAFEGTLESLATVAVLLTIVPSMGGAAGNQAVTLTIRGLALGHIGDSNYRWLIGKEVAIGALNGLVLALAIASVVGLWKHNWPLAGVIGAALFCTLLIANLAGVAIPLAMRRAGLDPAIAGNLLLTSVTDIIGLLSFLGLTTVILL
ncbi:MAG: magnesium transporter [Gammaproteobacteria bacterium]|nr:magnesium transporter [Gammaproteobacteria bacterium]